MDNLFAIGIGLALRAVIDTVTDHNHRVNGSLVGLWEGAVLHHFLAKFPRSLDPYVAFAFRLFVDLLFTASATRLAIVVLWTGLGMLLSDVGLDVAQDKRFRRLRRRVRRALPSSLHFFAPARVPSRVVQFSQMPANSSTASSNNTTRSPILRSPLSPQPRAQARPQPPPTLAPVRRPTTHPLPGAFSDWSEAETEASRAQRRAHTPSELEYMSLPVIPDTPGIDAYASFIRPPATRSVASGLTTSNESDSPAGPLAEDAPPQNYSGLTTPVELPSTPQQPRGDELPPVTILDDDAASGQDRTPTSNPVELPDPPPIPIPLRPVSGMPDAESMMTIPPELMDPLPTPGVTPPIGEVPDIPTPEDDLRADADADDAGTERGIDYRSPPPAYLDTEAAARNRVSLAETEATGVSVISTDSRTVLLSRADTLRKQAEQQEAARSKLRQELEAARRGNDHWTAFRLKVELEKTEQTAKELHAKAERRYYKAHNLVPEPQTIDVHRLKVPEARARVDQALYDAVVTGASQLRIITGRGNHSKGKIPALKLAIIGHLQDHHIEAVPDLNNPGVLLVNPPARPEAGSSST